MVCYAMDMKDSTTKSAIKLIKAFNQRLDSLKVNQDAVEYIALHGQFGFRTLEEEQEADLRAMYQNDHAI